jgi:Na+-driven multidrug efflux pump
MVYMALFLALGYGKEGGILSISRQGLFFIPAILILPRLFGLEGIIWAQPAADLLTVALTAVFSLGLRKKLKAIKTETKEDI